MTARLGSLDFVDRVPLGQSARVSRRLTPHRPDARTQALRSQPPLSPGILGRAAGVNDYDTSGQR